MDERNTTWEYDATIATQSRREARVSLRPPYAHSLTGVDGTLDGALRPFPGFIEVHRFDVTTWGAGHDDTSRILEVFPIDMVIGDGGYGYGFVYRVSRKVSSGSSLCDVFIDYFNSKTGEWVLSYTLLTGISTTRELDPVGGRQMSVQVVGRRVYVFIQGSEPISFSTSRTTPWGPQLRTETGPGKQPNLASPDEGFNLGDFITTGDADRPGSGQVFLEAFSPDSVGSVLSSTGWGEAGSEFRQLVPGDYSFAYVLYNSETGLHSSLSEIAQARRTDFGVPAIPAYAYMEICYDTSLYDQAYVYRSVRVQDAGGTYIANIIHLDAIITLSEWHSSNNPIATPDDNLAQAIYVFQLEDKQLVFQDTFTDRATYDDDVPKGGCAYWYENTMLLSNIPIFTGSTTDESRPGDATGGVGELRWSSLTDLSPELFPPSNRYTPNLPSNVIVAMQPAGPNVVGFSADRQYLIRKEAPFIKVLEMHQGFGVVNTKAAEAVGSMIYFVSPKGLKAVDSQGQLDDVASLNDVIINQWADSYASITVSFDPFLSLFTVLNGSEDSSSSAEAHLFWLNTGRVTHLEDLPFTCCFRGPWPRDFIYDPVDLLADNGADNDTYFNPLVERTFFVQNSPRDTTENLSGFVQRLLMVDSARSRTQAQGLQSGESRHTLLPFEGGSVFTVASTFSAGTTLNLTIPLGDALTNDLWGARLYVLASETPSLVGRSAKIRARPSASSLSLGASDAASLYGLAAGDVVGISPIPFRVVFWPAGGDPDNEGQGGSQRGYFRMKHFSTLACVFSDVSGSATESSEPICRYRALAYRGSETTPAASAETRDNAGELVTSVQDHEATYWAAFGPGTTTQRSRTGVDGAVLTPGVEVLCPDLDFYLVEVLVSGSWLATSRTRRSS